MESFILTIAGSDPSGGAGVQADLKTFAELDVKAVSAITAITAQNDDAVVSILPTPADILTQQLSAACRNRKIAAAKIGMVATRANARAIAWFLKSIGPKHIVIDPVFHSSSGAALLEPDAFTFFKHQLLPMATVITPNLAEAGMLAGMQVASIETMKIAAVAIHKELMGNGAKPGLIVIVKGGHLSSAATEVVYDGSEFYSFEGERIHEVKNIRGTGCRFSSALAAFLVKGEEMHEAVVHAKEYVAKYIAG